MDNYHTRSSFNSFKFMSGLIRRICSTDRGAVLRIFAITALAPCFFFPFVLTQQDKSKPCEESVLLLPNCTWGKCGRKKTF